MSSDLARRAEEVFLAIAELPPERWETRLQAMCQGDRALLDEVRSLLGYHDRADRFLDARELMALTAEAGHAALPDETLEPGTKVGDYTVRGLLGVGGMGSVYVAEQERPRRTVALKIIARSFATRGLVRRFEREAEMLGRLHHPGIAQVFESGSASVGGGPALPFISMELINGPTLTVYANEPGVDARRKLELMAGVCDAVQHAHQRGVIHRDLKPANILVDESGRPKVLDFGVARATDPEGKLQTMRTSVGQLVGTLPYMSPEQVLGDPAEVDTRSDVYALGVILYQLLTGKLPHDVSSRSIPEAARMIREEAPTRLSSFDRSLRGEIDTIVAKAMEKNRERRYQTAAALGDDIRRHLAGEPILAKQDSGWYVLRKQMQRHRWVLGASMAFVLGLAVFAVYASVQAQEQRRLAELERVARVEADHARAAATRASEDLERSLYISRIGHAQAALTLEDAARARGQLNLCPEPMRGWEWRLLDRLCDQSIGSVDLGVTGCAMVATRDGTRLVVAPPRGAIRVVDASTFEVIRTIERPFNRSGFNVSPDSRLILDVISRGGVVVFDAATGAQVGALADPVDGTSAGSERFIRRAMFISPTEVLVFRHSGECEIYPATGGDAIARWKLPAGEAFMEAALSPSGEEVAVTYDSMKARVHNPRTGEVLATSTRFTGSPVAVTFSPDGRDVAVGTFGGNVGTWRWRSTDTPVGTTSEPSAINTLAYNPDGSLLIAAGRGRNIWAWNARDLSLRWRQRSEAGEYRSAAFVQDGKWVVSTGGGSATLRLWSTTPRPGVPRVLVGRGPIFGLVNIPRTRDYLVTCRDGTCWRVNSETLRLEMVRAGPASSRNTLVLADGRFASVCEDSLRIWDLGAPDQESVVSLPHAGMTLEAAPSSDGARVALGGIDGQVTLVQTQPPHEVRVLRAKGSGQQVKSVGFLPDGRIVAAEISGTIRVLDPSGSETQTLELGARLESMTVSVDGTLLAAGSRDGSGRIWNLRDGASVPLQHSTDGELVDMIFVPGDERLAATSADQSLHLWLTRTGEEVAVFPGNAGSLGCVAVEAGGKTLATGSVLGYVTLWELESPVVWTKPAPSGGGEAGK